MSGSRSYEPADLWHFTEMLAEREPHRREEFHRSMRETIQRFADDGLTPQSTVEEYDRYDEERKLEEAEKEAKSRREAFKLANRPGNEGKES